ncbi:MAG: DUF58 domain-containing protein [Granulosicoccus sp.]
MRPGIPRLQQSALWQRVFRSRAEDTLPHKITHKRVYIVPSGRGCAFIVTLLLMLVASINYSLSLGYALCFLLTGLFASTLLQTYRNLAGLNVSAIVSYDAFAGDEVAFHISLANQQTHPRHGIRVSAGNNSTRVRIAPTDQTDACINIKTESRGICRLGRLTLQSDWPLGLWTCWSYLHVATQSLVFPKPEEDVPPLPVASGADDGKPTQSRVTGDVSGIRDYQPGDSIGSIAWKSAARGLGLQSRTFDMEAANAATVLDLQHATIPGLEAQLSRLCAWVLQAERTQTDYTFHLPEFTLDKSRGKEQQAQALRALALFGVAADNTA